MVTDRLMSVKTMCFQCVKEKSDFYLQIIHLGTIYANYMDGTKYF
jgi:hypothetical protein